VLGGDSQATAVTELDQALELIDSYRGRYNRRITLGEPKTMPRACANLSMSTIRVPRASGAPIST